MSGNASGKRLIVLGASARAAAHSAARAGLEPYAIDLFADRDLVALCPTVRIERYPAGFLPALAAAPDVPWMYTGGLENYPRLVEQLTRVRPLWGNRGDSLRAVRDPCRLARVLTGEGFRVPKLRSTGMERGGGKWLVKPRRGSGGLGVRWANDDDFARPNKGCVIQQYMEGECCSATYVAAGGRAVLLGATQQLVGRDWDIEPPFVYVGSLAPLALSTSEYQRLARLGEVLASRFGLVGLVGVDFVRAEGEIWPLEVNPRYTASVEVLERVTGRSLVADHMAACADAALPDEAIHGNGGCAGKAVVYARRPCIWRESVMPDAADVPNDGQTFEPGQPLVSLFASGDRLAAVERSLRSRAAAVLDQVIEARRTAK